jgi:uncharacterized protein YbjT (DUF2867 family)
MTADSTTKPQRVLLAGAGGVLGKSLIQVYLARGAEVSAFGYSPREFDGIQHPRLKTFGRDVTKPDQLKGLCDGMDIVISCVGITRMKANLTHMDVDFQGNLNLLREAEQGRVQRFAFISPEGVDSGDPSVPLLYAKHRFEQELKKSPLDWVIFHAGGFFTDLAEMGKTAAKGSMFLVGNGHVQFTPVHVEDLATVMADEIMSKHRQVVSVGGPETLSWNQICEICFQHYGRTPRISRVPVWLAEGILQVIRPFSARYHAMGNLILFMSTRDAISEQRGGTPFAKWLKSNQGTGTVLAQ